MTAWINGEFTDHPLLRADGAGALLGWGVFTTIGIRDGRPRFFTRHFERLRRDATAVDLEINWDLEPVRVALAEIIARKSINHGLARLTLLSRGDGHWSRETGADLVVLARETPPRGDSPRRLQLSNWQPEASRPLAGIKTTAYLPYTMAWRSAHTAGFEDALLLNSRDDVCETARASVFWRQGNILYTPSTRTGCLAGIGRELVIQLAPALGLSTSEGEFSLHEALAAEEFFTVSAAAGPLRVDTVCSGTTAHDFRDPSIGHRLQAAWDFQASTEI